MVSGGWGRGLRVQLQTGFVLYPPTHLTSSVSLGRVISSSLPQLKSSQRRVQAETKPGILAVDRRVGVGSTKEDLGYFEYQDS